MNGKYDKGLKILLRYSVRLLGEEVRTEFICTLASCENDIESTFVRQEIIYFEYQINMYSV